MKNEPFSLELLSASKPVLVNIGMKRDQCVVIERRLGNPAAFKKAMKAMRATLKGVPLAEDTAIDFKRTRESRGRV